ncbi:YdcF family protein [Neobacillus muris]|uniref:YdcF family protein n=1 Tax=Neobacillus muris TaxID=2941334 RepID=UPI0020422642|nr:YdcF family protein [Neobacillus muris]
MLHNKRVRNTIGILIVVGLFYTGFLQFKISQYSDLEPPKNADYLIILGARVKGTTPTSVFATRIQAAANYLKENQKTIAIASGGKGQGEAISEAEAIKRELVKQGIDESRILLEDRSTSTYENILFSRKLLPKENGKGVVVTNAFHMYRALAIARQQDLELSGLPSKTPIISVPKNYLREYMAITKYLLDGKI